MSVVYFTQVDLADYTAKLPHLKTLLSPCEKKALLQIGNACRQDVFILGHGLVHQVLGHYTKMAPASVAITRTDAGKWYAPDLSWHFSLSHSGNCVCLAFTEAGSVGVDVEDVSKNRSWDRVVEKYFSADEKTAYAVLSKGHRFDYAYRRWVYKEAWLKVHGLGVFACKQVVMHDPSVWCHQPKKAGNHVWAIVVESDQSLIVQTIDILDGFNVLS